MGKPKKTKTKFNYNKNRKKLRKKAKKGPEIRCSEIKKAWDVHTSAKKNLHNMGLSADPNATLPIPTTKDMLGPADELGGKKTKMAAAMRLDVARSLETAATAPRERGLRLSDPECEYCIYMMERHGEDYKAMARDERNYYQDTPKQIRRKINTFKSCRKQYRDYLDSKAALEEMDTASA